MWNPFRQLGFTITAVHNGIFYSLGLRVQVVGGLLHAVSSARHVKSETAFFDNDLYSGLYQA